MAAPLVCTARGLPYVDVSYGPLIPTELLRVAGRGAAQHWQARGLQPDPLAGLLRYLYVDICPPALQNPELALLPAVQSMRPVAVAPAGPTPDELSALPDRPLIYLTLGTVYNRDLSVFAYRAGGPAGRTGVGGRDHRAEQRSGGAGSAATPHRRAPLHPAGRPVAALLCRGHPRWGRHDARALVVGLPLLCLPQGADQHGNADRVVAAGAELQLLRGELTPQAIRAAVAALLDEPGYRPAARRIAGEIAAMPAPAEALAAITRLLT